MGVKDRNLLYLEKRIHWLEENQADVPAINVIEGLNNEKTAKVITSKGEIFLHSVFDPYHEARTFWDGRVDKIKKNALVVLVGLGLGYQAKELCKQRPDLGVLVVEPHRGLLELALETMDFSFADANWRFQILACNDPDKIKHFISSFLVILDGRGLINGVEVFFHPVLEEYFLEWKALVQAVKMAVANALVNRGTKLAFAVDWHINNLRNLPSLIKDPAVNVAKNIFQGIPAILVGAGPSLAENIEALRKIYQQKSALIICAGTAYPYLIKNGVVPHILATVDAGKVNWEGIQPWAFTEYHDKTWLLYDSITYPDILKDYFGPKLWAYSNCNPWDTFFEETWQEGEAFPVVASVSTYMVNIALHWGCSPIVLLGNDYALRKDRVRYAQGVIPGFGLTNDPEVLNVGGEWVDSYSGEKVFSTHDYSPARVYVGQLAQVNPNIVFYNVAWHGAVIQDVPYKDLNYLANDWTEGKIDLNKIKTTIEQFKPSEEKVKTRLSNLKKICQDLQYRIKACRKGRNQKETIRLAMDLISSKEGLLIRSPLESVLYTISRGNSQDYLGNKDQCKNFVWLCQQVLSEVEQVVNSLEEY